jgi:SAM-dependent methyltransferase
MNMHSSELDNEERQVAPTIEGIRRDHVARYEFAAGLLGKRRKSVIDLACGIGYGAALLADVGHNVIGIDRSVAAIDYGKANFRRKRVALHAGDVMDAAGYEADAFDAAVCFETIEHLADPLPMLRALRAVAPVLIASVPNEAVFPFKGYRFHHRHYTRAQFASLLEEAGFEVTGWYGQVGPDSDVEPDVEGRTLVVRAKRSKRIVARAAAVGDPEPAEPATIEPVPDHVCILGLGPSLEAYVDHREAARRPSCLLR